MVAALIAGCAKKTEAPAQNTPVPVTKKQVVQTAPDTGASSIENESKYVYEAKNRRDPFKPLLTIESKINIDKVRLVGFFQDNKKHVKAIVEDETGNSYYLSEGDFLGEAKIVSLDIKEKKVIMEIQKDYYISKKTLSLGE